MQHGKDHVGYSVSIAALLMGTYPNRVQAMAKAGKIRRWHHRVSHAQKNVVWFYDKDDVDRLSKNTPGLDIKKSADLTKRYITAQDAAAFLGIGLTAVYSLAQRTDGVRLRTLPKCRFTFPRKREAMGYRLQDVYALKRRREKTELIPTYMEETVEKASIKVRLKLDLSAVQPGDLFEAFERGEISADETVARLKKRLLSVA